MKCSMEDFYLGQVRFQQIWLIILVLEVVGEFGKIVNFDIVFCSPDCIATRSTPAIVISCLVVDLKLLLFRDRKFEEVLRQCELSVYLFLAQPIVLNVELR